MNKKTIPNYAGEFLKPDRKLNRVGKPPTFGDFVRGQLKNPNSEISQRVNFFKKFTANVKKYPNLYDFQWFIGLPIYKALKYGLKRKNEYQDCWYPFCNKNCIADFRP